MDVERRTGKRYGSHFGIVFNDEHGLNFSFIGNLSRSGAYLVSRRTFPIGSRVEMRISNGELDAPLSGKIVRLDVSRQVQGKGMGVRFDHLDPTAKRVRDDLLLYLMNLKYHSKWNQ